MLINHIPLILPKTINKLETNTHRLKVVDKLLLHNFDVWWENPAYGGAISVFLDKPFPNIYIHTLFLYCAESEKKAFCIMLLCDKKSRLWSDAVQNVQCLIKACSFCPSICWVFSDDFTIIKFGHASGEYSQTYIAQQSHPGMFWSLLKGCHLIQVKSNAEINLC